MPKSRVQAPNISGAPQRRPTGIPGDTFVAPQRDTPDDRLSRLAQSLQGFNANLSGLSAAMAPDRQKADEAAKLEAARIAAKTTHEEAARLGREGGQLHRDPVANLALSRTYGRAYGRQREMEWKEELTRDFDWDNGDVDAWVTERMSEDLEGLKDDKMRTTGYLETASGVRDWALGYREQHQAARFVQRSKQAAFDELSATVEGMANEGNSPAEIAANLAAFEKGARLALLPNAPYVDAAGKPAVYSQEQQREHAVTAFLAKSEGIARERRETQVQRLDRELEAFAPSGEAHPQWKAKLSAYPQGVDVATLSNPEARAAIVSDLALFRHIKTKAPTMLPAVTTETSRAFFNNAMLAQQYLGLDDERAIAIAHRAGLVDDPEAGNPLAGQEEAIRSAVDGVNRWSFIPDADNTRDVKVAVKKVAKLLALSGGDPAEAIDKAAKFVWDNSDQVNGRMLNLDIPVPATFADYAEILIDRTADTWGYESDELQVVHTGGGTFMMVTRGLGMPVSDNKGIIRFDVSDLIAVEEGELAKGRAEILKRREVRQKFAPWDDGGIPVTGTRHFP